MYYYLVLSIIGTVFEYGVNITWLAIDKGSYSKPLTIGYRCPAMRQTELLLSARRVFEFSRILVSMKRPAVAGGATSNERSGQADSSDAEGREKQADIFATIISYSNNLFTLYHLSILNYLSLLLLSPPSSIFLALSTFLELQSATNSLR